jgi:hypothetical protein
MITCFPDPYPDELLYSIWARFSDRVRYPSEKRVLIDLFDKARIRPIIDLPCHIGLFTEKLPVGCTYTADNFIDQHTLFPFYSPFMSRERATALREQMIANESQGHPQGFYRRFGIVNSLVPRMPWLRYCPVCWQEDRTNFGEAYWHRRHQVPGFEICPLHGTFIENSSVGIRSHLSSRTLVSANCILSIASPRFADPSPLCKALICIAENIDYLLEHPGNSLSPDLFRDQYRTLLATRGFLKRGIVHRLDLLDAFVDYYTTSLLTHFNCDMNNHYKSRSWLIRLVTAVNGYQHPLHHLLTMHFLGATAKDFFSQNIKLPSPFGEGPWPCLNPACEHYQQRCIITSQIVDTQRKENRPAGIFACTCGFMYRRIGPDCLPEDVFRRDAVLSYGAIWEAKLKELWLDPTISRRDIARFLDTSEGNVTNQGIKLHLANPRLSPRNREGRPRLIRNIQWYRTRWLALLEASPEKGRTSLKRGARSLYTWLYSNDRDWFIAHLPPNKLSIRRGSSKKDLTFQSLNAKLLPQDQINRDTFFAKAVKNASYQILLTPGRPKRVSRAAICSFVPQLFWLKSRPEKIPLTIQALEEVVETYEIFAIRRIQWVKHQYQMENVVPHRDEFLGRSNFRQHIHLPRVKEAFDCAMDELTSEDARQKFQFAEKFTHSDSVQ